MRNSLSPELSDKISSRKRTTSLKESEQPSSKRITSGIRRYYETGLSQHHSPQGPLIPGEKRRVSGVDIHSLIAKFDSGQTPKRYRRSSHHSQDSRLSLSAGSTRSSIDMPLDEHTVDNSRSIIRNFKEEDEFFGPDKTKNTHLQNADHSEFPKPHCVDTLRSRHSINLPEFSVPRKRESSTQPFLSNHKEELDKSSRCSICCRIMSPGSKTYAIVDGEYYCPAHFSLTIPVSLL